jgi:GNAT superfamily N-acetyltransferase
MSRAKVSIRSFLAADFSACLALFDQNCPEYFDPGERAEGGAALRWILIAPAAQGQGVGTTMMARALERSSARGAPVLHIAASQRSAAFFARFGARAVKRIPQGWGPQLDRIEMELDCL